MNSFDPTYLLSLINRLKEEYSRLGNELCDFSKKDLDQVWKVGKYLNEITSFKNAEKDHHELMNLVSALKGYVEILLDEFAQKNTSVIEIMSEIKVVIEATTQNGPEFTSINPNLKGLNKEYTLEKHLDSVTGQILAVDDREENLVLIQRQLKKNGHRVITASNGEDALKLLSAIEIDVVLLDLLMPGMDGMEVLQKIKEDARLRATSVIMISGQQDIAEIIKCIEAGADDYLFKPFNSVLLRARIKAGIDRKRWHDREETYRKQLERSEKFIRTTFGRYLSDDIVSQILEAPEGLELGGDLREVTILMSDIRGFTKLTETLPPAKVVKLLNRYLEVMSDIVMENDGTIDEFLGDAILAVFGAPHSNSDDADRAVKCAIQMQLAMKDVNLRNDNDDLPKVKTGIAINTGSVIAGNIGSERRSKYGFVGYPMNVTSRIEDKTRGGEVLISESTKNKLQDAYNISSSREIKVKGLTKPLLVHSISLDLEKHSK